MKYISQNELDIHNPNPHRGMSYPRRGNVKYTDYELLRIIDKHTVTIKLICVWCSSDYEKTVGIKCIYFDWECIICHRSNRCRWENGSRKLTCVNGQVCANGVNRIFHPKYCLCSSLEAIPAILVVVVDESKSNI